MTFEKKPPFKKFTNNWISWHLEIPDFLTDDECEHIMKQATGQGLENSIAKGGLTPKLSPFLPDNGM